MSCVEGSYVGNAGDFLRLLAFVIVLIGGDDLIAVVIGDGVQSGFLVVVLVAEF